MYESVQSRDLTRVRRLHPTVYGTCCPNLQIRTSRFVITKCLDVRRRVFCREGDDMKASRRVLWSALASVLLAGPAAVAQERFSSITGTVMDESGAAMPASTRYWIS